MEPVDEAAGAPTKRRKWVVILALAITAVILSAVGYLLITTPGPGNLLTPYAASYALQAPSTVMAGDPFQLTLTVKDQFGALFADYRGTAQFSSNDSAASLPVPHSYSASDAGVHVFTGLVLRTPGRRSLQVSDSGTPALTAHVTVNVSAAANRAPTITQVSSTPATGEVGQTVTFTAEASDPDGDPLIYTWDFGDGVQASGALRGHAYALPGHYVVALNVSDGRGGFAPNEDNLTFVTIFAPAAPAPSSPSDLGPTVAILAANRSNLEVGGFVTFNGNASWTYAWTPQPSPSPYWSLTFFTLASGNAYWSPPLFPNIRYEWGDGTLDTEGSPASVGQTSHQFLSSGNFPVVLNVTRYYYGTTEYAEAGYTVHVTNETPVPLIKSPDVFTMATDASPGVLDPAVSQGAAAGEVIQNVYETLVRHEPGSADAVALVPQLATVIPSFVNGGISADGKNYTFDLRQNVTFHDGSHLTAVDVAFSIQRVMAIHDPDGPSWTLEQVLTNFVADHTGGTVWQWVNATFASPGDVPPNIVAVIGPESVWDTEPLSASRAWAITNSSVAAVSQYQVVFHLTRVYPGFLQILAATAASVVSQSCVMANGGVQWGQRNEALDLGTDCGTGPFGLGTVQPHQRVALSRFAGYWAILPSLREVQIVDIEDISARELMLFSGDADTAGVGWRYSRDVLLPDETTPKYSFLRIVKGMPTLRVEVLGFNQNINLTATPDPWTEPTSFFADIHVRKAFAYAFDYATYISQVLYGGAARLNGALANGLLGYNPNIPYYPYDLAKAAAEFQKNATIWANGFTITLYWNSGNDARQTAALLLKSGLEKIHTIYGMPGTITVNTRALDPLVYETAFQQGGLPIVFQARLPNYTDPDDYVSTILRSGRALPSHLGYSNLTLDAMIDAAAAELDPTTRDQMYQTITYDASVYDVPYIWLDQATNFHVERTWVHGWFFNPGLWGLDYSALSKS